MPSLLELALAHTKAGISIIPLSPNEGSCAQMSVTRLPLIAASIFGTGLQPQENSRVVWQMVHEFRLASGAWPHQRRAGMSGSDLCGCGQDFSTDWSPLKVGRVCSKDFLPRSRLLHGRTRLYYRCR